MSKLHALLVGIDRYPPESGVPPLRGCSNDVLQWESLLRTYYGEARCRVLRDEQATYAQVVAAFGEIAAVVAPGDRCCFVFAGHGSREPAAAAFAPYFPEGLQETLVCYDSRLPDGQDLADKELLYLIGDLAERGAEVTVVLDCCHAGSGTRAATGDGTLIRRAPDRSTARPLTSYLRGRIAGDLDKLGTAYRLPNPRHLLLAACRRDEEARELPSRRGLLSSLVEQAIRESSGRISNTDLYRRISVGAVDFTTRQHPQLETYGGFDGSGGFLGIDTDLVHAELPVGRDEEGRWYVAIGARDGLPDTEPGHVSFRLSTDGKDSMTVTARSVGFDRTIIELPAGANGGGPYRAVLLNPPRPPASVQLRVGDPWSDRLMRARSAPSPFYILTPHGNLSPYYIAEAEGGLQIVRRADGLSLYTAVGEDADAVVAAVLERLDTIMRWEYLVTLDSTARSPDRGAVEIILEVRRDGGWTELTPEEGGTINVHIPHTDGRSAELPFRVSVRNTHAKKPLYAALFFTTEQYTFHFTGFNELVAAGTRAVAWEEVLQGVPTRFAASGAPSSLHLLKLFVGERELDVSGMHRPGFAVGETERVGARGRGMVPGIDAFGQAPAEPDWWAQTLPIRVVESSSTVGPREAVLLEGRITVGARSDDFRAEVTLGHLGAGHRGLPENDRLRELLEAQRGAEVVQFAGDTRGAMPYAVLELRQIHHATRLADAPLEMEIRLPTQDGEHLQLVAFDGEHLLPVGEVSESGSGHTLHIRHLPEPGAGDRRSLTGALKMVFLKYVLRQPGYRLRWVDYTGPQVRRRTTDLRAKVAAARRILLCIHGIIGDTEGMAAFGRPLVERGKFDLVLTFDYENLTTVLEDTSRALGEALRREAGIGPEHELVILAHSMGGLVARHFIELRRGGELVDRLIMAGTPNAGSEIAQLTKYRDGAVILLGMAINFGWSLPAAAALSTTLKASEKVTKTLEQMLPNSTYLHQLEDAPDPGVDYRVLAGNLNDYLTQHAETRRLLDKLYKLGGRLFYRDLPNDLAVSIASIGSVPTGREPAGETREVPGHHLNYFTDPRSTAILEEFLVEDEVPVPPKVSLP
ncbi:caspase family protein [Lewinella sp. JB7]|uniref:DUF7379 domain-containing protein n=1 Tax=Lewinella sp. JB7 TaxID=2962887 RepID=UPI0020C94F18|nr:caspase family protein [Lewinella sp. JB7]MCP9234623.1 caspase family protein [Lewinella sp. JB7]